MQQSTICESDFLHEQGITFIFKKEVIILK